MEFGYLKDYPQFIETVAEWIYKEFIENIRHGITYEKVIENFTSMTKEAVPCTIIMIENNICLGTASLLMNDLKIQNELTPWLGGLYVKKEYRNRDIGRMLINEILQISKSLGYQKLYLRTEHASQYYKELGWEYLFKTIDEFNIETEVFSFMYK